MLSPHNVLLTPPTFPFFMPSPFSFSQSQSLTCRKSKLLAEVIQPLKSRQQRLGSGAWSRGIVQSLSRHLESLLDAKTCL